VKALLYRLGFAANRLRDPDREEGFWERLFRFWP